MSLLKKIAGETAVYGLSSVVGRLLNYLLVPLHTAVFLPEEYGVYNYLYAYVGFLMVSLTYGFETAFFRFTQEDNLKKATFSTASVSLFVSTFIFLVGFLLFQQPLADLIQYPNKPQYIVWFAFIVAFDVLVAIPFARLRLESKAIQFAGIKIINILINIGLNVFFLWLCPYLIKNEIATEFLQKIYNPEIGIGYVFIANLVASAVTFFILLPTYFKQKLQFNYILWKKMFRYAAPLLLVGIAAMINELIDRILLKFCLNGSPEYIDGQIGIYGACYKLSILMTLFTQAYKMAVEPFFFSASKKQEAKTQYAQLMHYFVAFGGLIFIGVTFFIDIFKYFIQDESYWVGLDVVPILLMANLFLGIYFNLSVWYKLTDKTEYAAIISIIGAIITLVLNFTLIPIIGFYGSAWATLIVYFLMSVMSYFWGRKHYPVPYGLLKMGIILSLSILLFFVDFYALQMMQSNMKYVFKIGFLLVYLIVSGMLFFRAHLGFFKPGSPDPMQ